MQKAHGLDLAVARPVLAALCEKYMKTHISNNLLIHGSIEAELVTLKPLTMIQNNKFLYATSCPIFAAFHVLKSKYGYNIFLYRYNIFNKKIILCRIHSDIYKKLLFSKLTLYFVEPELFVKETRKVGIIEKFTLGFITNTNIEYITKNTIVPASKATITIEEITHGKFIKINKYYVCVNLT